MTFQSKRQINKPFQKILQKIKQFRDERDWMQFHNPKDMAEAIVIEASELLEIFLWKSQKTSQTLAHKQEYKNRIAEELADIFCFAFELADNLGIDIEEAILQKIQKNARKYPIEKAKGRSAKYTEL